MPYTVYRPAGVTDNQFTDYARLLSQSGFDLGRLRRVPDPATNKRWLPVWDTHAEAQEFADTLLERTGPPTWDVVEVHDRISEGPLGPILITFVKQGSGITFELNSLSRRMILSAHPRQVPPLTHAKIRWEDLEEYKQLRGTFADLVWQLAPALTGLDVAQVTEIGLTVADWDDATSAVFFPPRIDGQGVADSSVAPPGAASPLAAALAGTGG